jgi:hypothetical protein
MPAPAGVGGTVAATDDDGLERIGRRWAVALAGGTLIGAPRPARRVGPDDATGIDGASVGSSANRRRGAGTGRPALAVDRDTLGADAGRRLDGCSGSPVVAAGDEPRPVSKLARDGAAGSGASTGALCVNGRAGGVTVAAGATDGIVRIAGSSGATRAAAQGAGEDGSTDRETTGATASSGSQAGSVAWAATSGLACRWMGRLERGAWDVRLGTACGCATTRPGGALALDSWPSGLTTGGSGVCPGTPARNKSAGATTGGGPAVRWIGGSVRQAPVGRIGVSAGAEAAAGALRPASPAEPVDAPSVDVLRPNGHGRRTGLRPPRTGAD